MKKACFTFLMLAMIVHAGYAQVWESHPSGYSEEVTVFDVDMVDENTIWTTSYKGIFSGDAWDMVPSNLMSKSVDGGQTWMEIQVPVIDENWGISNVHALDGQKAFISLHSWWGPGAVYKTMDGGANWEDVGANVNFTNFVHFWDSNKGIAMGDPVDGYFEIYTTEDGGDSWMRVPSDNIPNPIGGEYGNFGCYAATGSSIWFGTSTGRIFYSNDYGQHWEETPTAIGQNSSYPVVEGISFKDDAMHGIAYSANYDNVPFEAKVVVTADGGLTWQSLDLADGGQYSIFDAKYIPGSPYLLKTSRSSNGDGPFLTSLSMDDGATWMDIDLELPIMRFDFISPTAGWGGKFKNDIDETRMYKYTGSPLSGLLSRQPIEVEMSVSPNPTTGIFNLSVEAPSSEDFLLLVNDANGHLVHHSKITQRNTFNKQLDLTGYPAGIYTVTLATQAGSRVLQVVKR